MNHYDPIIIGTNNRGEVIEWSFTKAPNFNILFQGVSGGGKTWTIHQMIARVFIRGMTFHIIDVKGDFKYSLFEQNGLGHMVTESDFNMIEFNYLDGASLNPLVIPRNKESGGVLRTIESVKELVKQFAPNTGVKQLGYLTDILRDVYAKKGIVHDDVDSWTNPPPTLDDVIDQIDLVASMITGRLPQDTVSEILDQYGKARKKAEKVVEDAVGHDIPIDVLRRDVAQVCDELVEILRIKAVQQLNYESILESNTGAKLANEITRDSLFGLRSTIRDMCNSRLFTGRQSRTVPGKINVYEITQLSPAHQQIIMRIVAGRVFAMGVQETKTKDSFNPAYPSHIMIADEGKHIQAISKSPLSPFNRIGTEGRGYGVGAWLGVQQPDQITPDLLKNFATYMLLKVPEASYKEMQNKFGLKPNSLKQLVARENILYSDGGSWHLLPHFKD
jgi:hypothetical protein